MDRHTEDAAPTSDDTDTVVHPWPYLASIFHSRKSGLNADVYLRSFSFDAYSR